MAGIDVKLQLTGDRFPASRLHAAGLISRLVVPGEALADAHALAVQIGRNAPLALAATKRIVVESADWNQAEAFARQNEIAAPVFLSADAMEGAVAFAEKRPPVWRGGVGVLGQHTPLRHTPLPEPP